MNDVKPLDFRFTFKKKGQRKEVAIAKDAWDHNRLMFKFHVELDWDSVLIERIREVEKKS
jgi:hypothetical protein